MDPLHPAAILLPAALLCSLVAGFLLAFAVVAMPGLKRLDDREFIRAFQVIDGVIQRRQPVFMALWLGSIVAVTAVAALGAVNAHGGERLLLLAPALTYLFGVQLSTFTINVPLNNQLQALEVAAMDATDLKAARGAFEPRWNRWNVVRTAFASLTSCQLLLLLYRM